MLKRFTYRTPDSQKQEEKGPESKPLSKAGSLFKPVIIKQELPGSITEGPFVKSSTKGVKVYYVSPHDPVEYFGLEILNLLGFNTPKARIHVSTEAQCVNQSENTDQSETIEKKKQTIKMAVRNIEGGFIPIAVFLEKETGEGVYSKWKDVHARYQLDIAKQVIVERKTGKEFKISGNLFTSNIGANLLGDLDFQPEDANVGLIKVGDRFYAYYIDKELIQFDGKSYDDRQKNECYYVNTAEIYKYKKDEQIIFIVNEIKRALDNGDFDKIFDNVRIKETLSSVASISDFDVASIAKMSKNFRETVESALKYFKDIDLDRFTEREALRKKIAEKVLELANFNPEDQKQIKRNIIEDLRGPYYEDLFINKNNITEDDINNHDLIKHILEDQIKEFEALAIPDLFLALKDFVISELKNIEKQSNENEVKDNYPRLTDLKQSILSAEETFSTQSKPEQSLMITNLIGHLDKVANQTTHSEKNWLDFKRKHQAYIKKVNPNYLTKLGFYNNEDKNKIKIDLEKPSSFKNR